MFAFIEYERKHKTRKCLDVSGKRKVICIGKVRLERAFLNPFFPQKKVIGGV